MSLSHAYGVPPPPDVASDILLRALDLGVTHFDAATLQRAHAVHPIAAVQSEYSLCTRNPEIAVI
jgi:aryl-alcohol dehydrogenase-like predicted oxidoreductase